MLRRRLSDNHSSDRNEQGGNSNISHHPTRGDSGSSSSRYRDYDSSSSSATAVGDMPAVVQAVGNTMAGSSSRDRTREFLTTIKSMQARQSNGFVGSVTKTNGLLMRSQFSQFAKKIGADLSNTYAKLEKLTVLAKRRSLFDDKPMEIQELTYIIKEDINNLNKQIARLQELVKHSGSKTGKHEQTHSTTVVLSLQSRLANMSNNFKSVLELRSANMREQRSRRDHFTHGSVSSSLPSSATQGYHTGSVLLQEELSSKHDGGEVSINMDEVDRQKAYQQQQLMEDTSYIESRANTMETIESTIVELGQIFQQLAHMVNEQEEQVQRIDSNVTDAQLNVDAAHSEILKYFQSVSSNRWLMVKIFLVLILFFIVFVVFLA